jgi:hypothetical protein
MSEDVSLREIAGSGKALLKLFKEREIDIDLFIRRAVERSDGGRRRAARRLNAVAEQNQLRVPVPGT